MSPYILDEDRPQIKALVEELVKILKSKGEYNYAMTLLAHMYLLGKDRVCYVTASDAHGLVCDVAKEFYRVVVAKYEDEKRALNGPVSELDA